MTGSRLNNPFFATEEDTEITENGCGSEWFILCVLCVYALWLFCV